MDLTIIARSYVHQHLDAIAEGAAKHGVNVTRGRPGGNLHARTIACWSWHVGRRYREAGANVLVAERGYLGDRFAWTSLGWNGLNGRAIFPKITDSSRFAANYPPLAPWREGGEYVLLIGQVPGDASLGGVDLAAWYRTTAQAAKRAYGLPVAFRGHPQALQRGIRQTVPGTTALSGDLPAALAGAAVVITFNSNVGVDAAVAGCPVVAIDRGSMAWEVAGHRVGDLVRPDREEWAARLAWCQWTLDEMRSGAAWEVVGGLLERKEAA